MYQDTSVSTFESNTYQTLGPKTFWFFLSERLKTGVGFLILALVLAVVRVQPFVSADMRGVLRLSSWVALAVGLISCLAAYIMAKLAHKSFAFALREDALMIRKGIFTQQESAIPYRQIQNIEIDRTFAQRMAGLSRLTIMTAVQDNPNVPGDEGESVIAAIDQDVAQRLQIELLRRSNIQKVVQANI